MSRPDETGVTDFLLLQEQVDELARLMKSEPLDSVGLPALAGGGEDEQAAVESGDVLGATLSAISRGTRRLVAEGGIALGGDPIKMQLAGEYAGMFAETNEIFVRVRPVKRGNKNGQ